MADEVQATLEPVVVTAPLDPTFAVIDSTAQTRSLFAAATSRAAQQFAAQQLAGSVATIGAAEGGDWPVPNGNGNGFAFVEGFGEEFPTEDAVGPVEDPQDPFGEAAGSGPVTWGDPSDQGDNWPSFPQAIAEFARQTGFPQRRAATAQMAAMPRVPTPTPRFPMPSVPQLAPRVMGAVAGLRAGARNILRLISARVGSRVTSANVVALVKRVGVEAAAVALGVTVAEIMQVVTAHTMRRRRRRGISHRDISRARSTIRRMTGFMSLVQSACAPAMGRARARGRRRHAPGCACVVCRRG